MTMNSDLRVEVELIPPISGKKRRGRKARISKGEQMNDSLNQAYCCLCNAKVLANELKSHPLAQVLDRALNDLDQAQWAVTVLKSHTCDG